MISVEKTKMHREAHSTSDAVRRFLGDNTAILADIAASIREKAPSFVATCARGSSDHAATFGKYIIETRLGLPVVSLAPSIASVFQMEMKLDKALFIAISQSGGSPDLVTSAKAARQSGALVVGLINAPESPLAKECHHVLPLSAGPELSVAATKSYILSLVALASLVCEWSDDAKLRAAIASLPAKLDTNWELDWSEGDTALASAENLFVVSRGLGLGIAQEAALKFKETSGIHAEAFSAAEVKHGPMALVKDGFPVLLFSSPDLGEGHHTALVSDFVSRGAKVVAVGGAYEGAINLESIDTSDTLLSYILMVHRFYRTVNRVAVLRGHNPDEPPFLKKVTETI